MPYKILANEDGSYRVIGPSGVHAKSTTKEKAEAQIQVMQMREHGIPAKKKKKKKGKLDWDTPKNEADEILQSRKFD